VAESSGEPGVCGVVAGLWRFPVKSLQGEAVDALTFVAPGPGAAGGAADDRAWGVVDVATGRVLSAKTVPALLEAAAVARPGGGVVVTLPDGTTVGDEDRPACDRALSAWLGRDVELRSARATDAGDAGPVAYDMTFDPPNDDAELVPIDTPAGSFVDLCGAHVLTTGALAAMAAAAPGSDWSVRRFRPNVLVDTGPAGGREPGGVPEDAWVGRRLALGTAALDVVMQTVRCALPLRAQPAGPGPGEPALGRDVGLYRTMAAEHANHLGVYAEVAAAGTVRVGDAVRLSPTA
jgi:uncharacterized protein YcbX